MHCLCKEADGVAAAGTAGAAAVVPECMEADDMACVIGVREARICVLVQVGDVEPIDMEVLQVHTGERLTGGGGDSRPPGCQVALRARRVRLLRCVVGRAVDVGVCTGVAQYNIYSSSECVSEDDVEVPFAAAALVAAA